MLSKESLSALGAMQRDEIYICNLVVTASFIADLDLHNFARVVGGTYRPSKFAAVRFRVKHPKCTMLVFGSGKCVCIGCMSVGMAEAAINQCFRQVCKITRTARISDISVQNIVSHTNMKRRVDLLKMAKENGLNTNYDPELFPGLRMSLQEQNARACIFFQGNVVVTGCKNFETLARVWSIVKKRTEPYTQHAVSTKEDTSPRQDPRFAPAHFDHLTHTATSVTRQLDRLTYECEMEVCE
ncbi:hypothetical protein CYMTET_44320 [Cymbomonas tetramitiformis]|uniref:TATA-box binding protein n=1 Tax=Cymbomonas tetramitiformis TaxID=36881 RepID=A0AAE0EZN9_9CHLO|nr:hypothetical protein CYMTET_44320 [Cymbomonas tetramitiformis]|eukprot:gene830-1307_t